MALGEQKINLTKKENLEKRIRLVAEDIFALNEKPDEAKVNAWVKEHKKTDAALKKWNAAYLMTENDGGYSEEWKSLCLEGAALICEWVKTFSPEKVKKHSAVLMKTASACFAKFDPEKGDIIHYLTASVTDELTRAEYEEKIDAMRCGVRVPQKKDRLARQFIAAVESMGKNPQDLKVQEAYCRLYGIKSETLMEALKFVNQTVADLEIENCSSLLTKDPLELLIETETHEQIKKDSYRMLERLELIWERKAERKNGNPLYYSVLITQWILEQVKPDIKNDTVFLDKLAACSFADRELLRTYKATGTVPDRKTAVNDESRGLKKDEGRASNDIKDILKELVREKE